MVRNSRSMSLLLTAVVSVSFTGIPWVEDVPIDGSSQIDACSCVWVPVIPYQDQTIRDCIDGFWHEKKQRLYVCYSVPPMYEWRDLGPWEPTLEPCPGKSLTTPADFTARDVLDP